MMELKPAMEPRQYMNDCEIADVTELFEGYSTLNTYGVFGTFFLSEDGHPTGPKIRENSTYDIQNVIQIHERREGKEPGSFYYTLS